MNFTPKKRTSGQKRAIIALIAALFAFPAVADEEKELTAKQVVEKIQTYYAGVDDYKASFVQTTAHKLFSGKLERSYGTLMFRKDGRMRWEYDRPEKKLFVYDNSYLWVYEPEVPQIFKGTADAERLRRALAFLTGQGKILDEYKVTKGKAARYGFNQGIVLKLKPKQKGSPFKLVELYLNKEDYHVVRSVVIDHDGNRNRLDFKGVQTNNGLADGYFEFTPPKGVPVTEGSPR